MSHIRNLLALAEKKDESLPCGTVVVADELSDGSGRFSRPWHAPVGGIWMALAWTDSLLPEFASLLPMATGTACCETLQSYGIDARVKWVNDIQVEGQKIAGILTETLTGPLSGEKYHLIGIGINCNNVHFPKLLRSSAISTRHILGRSVGLQEMRDRLLCKLTWNIGLVHFEEEVALRGAGGIESDINRQSIVLDAWRNVSDTVGRRVCYGYDVVHQPLYEATVEGVNNRGGLVMRLDDDTKITEYAGEIVYL